MPDFPSAKPEQTMGTDKPTRLGKYERHLTHAKECYRADPSPENKQLIIEALTSRNEYIENNPNDPQVIKYLEE